MLGWIQANMQQNTITTEYCVVQSFGRFCYVHLSAMYFISFLLHILMKWICQSIEKLLLFSKGHLNCALHTLCLKFLEHASLVPNPGNLLL